LLLTNISSAEDLEFPDEPWAPKPFLEKGSKFMSQLPLVDMWVGEMCLKSGCEDMSCISNPMPIRPNRSKRHPNVKIQNGGFISGTGSRPNGLYIAASASIHRLNGSVGLLAGKSRMGISQCEQTVAVIAVKLGIKGKGYFISL
jgi:hypothetical protein